MRLPRSIMCAALAGLLTVPVQAQEVLSADQAEMRLRGCLLAGAAQAPGTSLREAVIATRAFCTPQIRRVQKTRVDAATAGMSGAAADEAERQAITDLNDEIARAIANFTGLTTY